MPDTRAIIAVPACLATEPVGVPINSMSAASRPYTQRPLRQYSAKRRPKIATVGVSRFVLAGF
eukprot:4195473-Amphidinium_carterae.1